MPNIISVDKAKGNEWNLYRGRYRFWAKWLYTNCGCDLASTVQWYHAAFGKAAETWAQVLYFLPLWQQGVIMFRWRWIWSLSNSRNGCGMWINNRSTEDYNHSLHSASGLHKAIIALRESGNSKWLNWKPVPQSEVDYQAKTLKPLKNYRVLEGVKTSKDLYERR